MLLLLLILLLLFLGVLARAVFVNTDVKWPRRNWVDNGVCDVPFKIALLMSRHCYITSTLLVVLIRFLYFCNFPNDTFFFKATRGIPFQCYVQRLFSVDKHIVLLE